MRDRAGTNLGFGVDYSVVLRGIDTRGRDDLDDDSSLNN